MSCVGNSRRRRRGPRAETETLPLTDRASFLKLSDSRAQELRGSYAQRLYAIPTKDHQAVLFQPGYDPTTAARRVGQRVVPRRGGQTSARLEVSRRRHAEARRAAVAH